MIMGLTKMRLTIFSKSLFMILPQEKMHGLPAGKHGLDDRRKLFTLVIRNLLQYLSLQHGRCGEKN